MTALTNTDSSGSTNAPSQPVPSEVNFLPARFEQVREFARGGMGRVLVAFDRLHAREVAIKESLSASVTAVKRFEREALLTARLQHPGVVPVYEVARRATGEPYLVMRRVHGRPLKDAIAQASNLTGRLRLLGRFSSVVETMAYAHQRGVIHRDLKPANVLLGDFGDTVIIDWGLAKDLGEHPAADDEPQPEVTLPTASPLTVAGAVVGTFAYMSPEQAAGLPVDARTDVYALGAMLYELLSGTPPHVKDTGGAAVRREAAPLAVAAPGVPEELVTIVTRAMAVEPSARYADARALAFDLQAFQTGRLVASHAYSTSALVSRWARRHGRVLGVALLSVVALAVLGTVSVRRVLAERDRANREAASAQRVADFMTQMFSVVDPSEARGNVVTAREILDHASQSIETGLTDDRALRAKLMKTMGEVYLGLGLYTRSEALLTGAVGTNRSLSGADDPETLRAQSTLARLWFHQAKFKESEALAREVLERQTRVLGPEAPDTLSTLNTLGDDLRDQSHWAQAEALHRQAYEARSRVLGQDDRATLVSFGRIADDVHEQGRYDESAALFEALLARRKAAFGADDLDTVWAMNGLSSAYQKLGRQADAEKLDAEAVDIRTRVLGPEHPTTLESMQALGNDHFDRGDFAGAEKLYAAVQEVRTRVLGPEHMWTLAVMNNRANALSELGQLERAEAMHRAVLAVRIRVLGPDHAHVLLEKAALAEVLRRQKRFAEATALIREQEADRLRVFGPTDRGLSHVAYGLASIAADQGQADEALAQLERYLSYQPAKQDQLGLLTDPTFAALHSLPMWQALAAKVSSTK